MCGLPCKHVHTPVFYLSVNSCVAFSRLRWRTTVPRLVLCLYLVVLLQLTAMLAVSCWRHSVCTSMRVMHKLCGVTGYFCAIAGTIGHASTIAMLHTAAGTHSEDHGDRGCVFVVDAKTASLCLAAAAVAMAPTPSLEATPTTDAWNVGTAPLVLKSRAALAEHTREPATALAVPPVPPHSMS